ASAGAEDDVRGAVGYPNGHELVAVDEVDRYEPGVVDVAVLRDRGALHEAALGGEHEAAAQVEALDGEHGLDDLVVDQLREHVPDVPAASVAVELRQVVDLLAVDPPAVREEQQEVVRAAHEQHRVEVVVLGALAGHPAPAAALGPVGGDGRALDVALARERDDHLLLGDQVVLVEVLGEVDDLRAALVAEALLDLEELAADDPPQLALLGEDQLEPRDLLLELAVLLVD